MNSKKAKKLRKYYRDGFKEMGMKDVIEYIEIKKKKERIFKAVILIQGAVIVCLITLLIV